MEGDGQIPDDLLQVTSNTSLLRKYDKSGNIYRRVKIWPLLDLSAMVVSKHLPFTYVQRNVSNLSERVAKSIMFWSFPRCANDILRYSSVDDGIEFKPNGTFPFSTKRRRTTRTKRNYLVTETVQIGFSISGTISDGKKDSFVTLGIDRCVITWVKCSCTEPSILWCEHAITLALYRLNNGSTVPVSLPIFDEINRLDRDQLQILLQYMLSNVPKILPEVQSEISNTIRLEGFLSDIQDVTICYGTENVPWFLDIHTFSTFTKYSSIDELIWKRVIDMMIARDANGLQILQILIEPADRYAYLKDNITILWACALATPYLPKDVKDKYKNLLSMMYVKSDNVFNAFAFENVWYIQRMLFTDISREESFLNISLSLLPLCASELSWENNQLRNILWKENSEGKDLRWNEHLPASCLRIIALQFSGDTVEAIRLSVAIARAIKHQALRWKEIWKETESSWEAFDVNKELVEDTIRSANGEWMSLSVTMHIVDPVKILFATLQNAPRLMIELGLNLELNESDFFQMAVESVIILFSQCLIPNEMFLDTYKIRLQQEKWMKRLRPNHIDVGAIRNLVETLLESGPFTLCGNLNCLGTRKYETGLSMVMAIRLFDEELSVKFALSCLKNEKERLFDEDQGCITTPFYTCGDFHSLFQYVISEFSDDITLQVLNISFKGEDIGAVGEFILSSLFERNVIRVDMLERNEPDINNKNHRYMVKFGKEKQIVIFDWLLERLNASLHCNRLVNGRAIFVIASLVGLEQILHLLRNWEKYILLSESLELGFCQCPVLQTFSPEEKAVYKTEVYKLAQRLIKAQRWGKVLFKCLNSIFYSSDSTSCYSVYRPLREFTNHFSYLPKKVEKKFPLGLTEEEATFKRQLFDIGMTCANEEPRHFMLHELPSVVFNVETFDLYYDRLLQTLLGNIISSEDILDVDVCSRLTTVKSCLSCMFNINSYCKYKLEKLTVKYCNIPISYLPISNIATPMISNVIDVMKQAEVFNEAEEMVAYIIENVKSKPVLYDIIKSCYNFVTEDGRKPKWLRKLMEEEGMPVLDGVVNRK